MQRNGSFVSSCDTVIKNMIFCRFFLLTGRWLLDTEVAGMAGVGRFVVGLLDDIRIIEGPELTAYLQAYMAKNAL